MHPIVRKFIETNEPLQSILEKNSDSQQFLEMVLIKLIQSKNNFKDILEKQKVEMYLELDQAVLQGHPDTMFYFLFISCSIDIISNRGHSEKAKALLSIGLSIPQDKIHPALQSYFMYSMAVLKLSEHKMAEGYELLQKSMAVNDKKSPRYKSNLFINANLFAAFGLLNELDPEDLALLNSPENESQEFQLFYLKLSSCAVLANAKEGLTLIEEYKGQIPERFKHRIVNEKSLFNILLGDFEEKTYIQENILKLYAKVCNSLNTSNFKEALKYYNLGLVEMSNRIVNVAFMEYFPLHIELCLRNAGTARLLYQEMQQKVGHHYMDDFYLARIQLLEKNSVGAYETFSQLIKNVNRYDAINRLIFELQFAKELKTADILLLMNGVNKKEVLKDLKSKKEDSVIVNKQDSGFDLLIGASAGINQVKELVKKFGKLKECVLITGETGTGKELVSRAIHDESAYPKEPFLPINCGALTESLLQSELFGYEAGAFTGAQKERKGIFEAAGKGTVFLDEFGDISPKMQVALLRVLESNEIRLIGGTKPRQIECKIVIATNIDLQQAVEDKKFREDLYFRLARFDIKLPSLRERQEDIPALINYFLNNQRSPYDKPKVLSKELMGALMQYHWPGNIRELKNEIERLKILSSDKEVLTLEDFDFKRLQGAKPFIAKPENKVVENKLSLPKPNKKELVLDHEKILKIVQRGSKTEMRLKIYKELFQVYKKLTRSQLIEITSVSPGTATKDLQSLCEAGFIAKQTPTKSSKSHYFILVE